MEKDIEVAVVGGGVMGVCTALCLQLGGRQTILVDQYPLPHSLGSSGGQARITRLCNSGPPQLTHIIQDANTRWQQLAGLAGEELISPAPLLVCGNAGDTVRQRAQAMEQVGQKPNWLAVQEANHKYKTRYTEDFTMFEDTTAGVLRADCCIAAVIKLFKAAGGIVKGGWEVTDIQLEAGANGPSPTATRGPQDIPSGPTVILRGPQGTLRAPKLVLCPGPWATHLLGSVGLHPPLQPIRSAGFFYQNSGLPHASIVDVTNKNTLYLLPAMDGKGTIKVGHGGVKCSPGDSEPELTPVGEGVDEYIRKYLPLSGKIGEETCWYTDTPDKEFILDRHPDHPNIVFGVGFSGNGFKIAPTVGYILACMVTGQVHGFDVSPFTIRRFEARRSNL